MSKATLSPLCDITDNFGNFTGFSVNTDGEIVNTSDCPFPFLDETHDVTEKLYKIYNDGGHYVATPYFHGYKKRRSEITPFEQVFDMLYYEALKRQRNIEKCKKLPRRGLNANAFLKKALPMLRARFPHHGVTEKRLRRMIKNKYESMKPEKSFSGTSAIDIAFDSLYAHALRLGLKEEELIATIKSGLEKLSFEKDLDKYIADMIEKKTRNFYARKKRFRRKANLNRWTHFVTFTYDDKLHSADSFRKKLRKCLSNMHTRRGWRYMGVFEESPETGRLHFHGLLYIPKGQMVGSVTEKQDYSTKQGKIQITHSNDFFAKAFGRNDFEELSEMELRHGQTLNYLLKYIEKTGERIVYSRGIPTQVCKVIPKNDIVGRLQDFVMKFVLFDDTIDWERDVMKQDTNYKQMTVIDWLCNPPRNVA